MAPPAGTDSFVASRALLRGLPVEAYPVDQALDGPWPAAGHRRNRRMLLGNVGAGPADELAAFWGERGTAGAVKAALALGLPVWGWNGRLEAFTAVQDAGDWEGQCRGCGKRRDASPEEAERAGGGSGT